MLLTLLKLRKALKLPFQSMLMLIDKLDIFNSTVKDNSIGKENYDDTANENVVFNLHLINSGQLLRMCIYSLYTD